MRSIPEINGTNFEAEVLKSKQPVLVSFWAAWSQPCQTLGPVLDEVAAECNGRVKVFKVNVDYNSYLELWFGIQSIPTLLCFVNGEVVATITGTVSKEEVLAMLKPFVDVIPTPGKPAALPGSMPIDNSQKVSRPQMGEQQFEMENQRPKENRSMKLGAILTISWTVVLIWLNTAQAQSPMTNSAFHTVVVLKPSNLDIWQTGIGEGFKSGIQSVGFGSGTGSGLKILDAQINHDLTLPGLSYGYTPSSVKGGARGYRGGRELRDELFCGGEFSPGKDWLANLTPDLRYNFATGTGWIPYVDGGAEVTATGVGSPDLSHTFEINLQAATGVRWLIDDNAAPRDETCCLGLTYACMDSPNLGLNNMNGMPGISWFSDDTQ